MRHARLIRLTLVCQFNKLRFSPVSSFFFTCCVVGRSFLSFPDMQDNRQEAGSNILIFQLAPTFD
ncbi:hypothetical protein DS820_12830 [Escherichia coli]|nr:hypothetical protein [Escherichia coli]